MKLIWYLPTWGKKCTSKELQPFLFGKFDLGHPVQYCASISTYLCHKDRQNGRMPNDRYLIEFQVEMTPNFFVCSSFDSRLKRN